MPNKNTTMDDTAQEANRLVALALAKSGLVIFPAAPNKRPLVKNWQTKATDNTRQIDRWWSKWPDAMPALPTGKRNGLAVLDVDLKDGKDGGAALRDLGQDPDTLSAIRAETPSNGQHIYFRWPDGMGNSASGLPDGVDVRGEGGFVIAPGAVNGKGVHALNSGSLRDDLPDWPAALLPRPKAVDHGEAQPTGLPFKTIRDALMALPNDGDEFAKRDDWLRIGMALHAKTGGGEGGRDAWHDWPGQWPGYDDSATDAAWDSFKSEGGVTGFTIMAEAEQRGWHDLSAFDDLPAEDKLAELDAILLGEPQPKAKNKSKLTFLSPSDCERLPTRRYVVVVGAARSLTRWGAAVVLVHHDTKAGDGLPRGHSILNGALDMSLHLKRDGTVVRGKPTKNRNGSIDQELAFSVGVVRQGVDEDGDPISTAICDEEDVAELPTKDKPLPASAKAALDILEGLLVGRESIPIADWRAACLDSAAMSGAEEVNDRRKAFRRALEQLACRDQVTSSDGEYSIPDLRAEVFDDDDG